MSRKNIKIVIGILSIIIIATVILIYIFCIKESDENINYDDDDIRHQIEELLENDYRYYLLKNGCITLGEGSVTIDEVEYYYVNEPWLTSEQDVQEIVFNKKNKKNAINKYNEITDKYKFIVFDDNIFADLSQKTDVELAPKFDTSKYTYRIIDEDTMIIKLDTISIYAYLEDGTWKLNNSFYSLLD